MFLRNVVLATSILASGTSLAPAAQPDTELEMNADGEVQIATDGHVSDYRLQSKLTPELAKLVDRNVRSWTFEPVVIDGKPVIAKTAMHIKLKAAPIPGDNESIKVQIVDIGFGEPKRMQKMLPPHYPQEAVAARLGAKVLLSLRLDSNGDVAEVQPYQTSLDARPRSEHEAEQWRRTFEKASITAAKNWHYDLSETINGKPIGTTVMVPIVYSLTGPWVHVTKPGEWKAYLPGPVHRASWLAATSLADNRDVSNLEEGQALSLDSRFRLKDNVIGKTL